MGTPVHLNPDTPLAFLPPDTANQFEISRYLLVATCGMFSWDVLCNLKNDYKLLTKYRISLPALVYFVSRIATFAYIITGMVYEIQPIPNCAAASHATGWCFAIAVPATSLLIFFRVHAVFNSDRFIIALFTFLWLSTLAASLTVPFAISGGHIGPTDHCINTLVKPFSSASIIVFTVNDTLAFFFISWRLLHSSTVEDTYRARLKSFLSGKNLPAVSRALLQSGQEYYLITVGGNILTMAMILAPASLPLVYHAMFTVPNIAIGNSMACRVYRNIRFGRISSNGTTFRSTNTPVVFYSRKPVTDIFHKSVGEESELRDVLSTAENGGVHVQRTVEEYVDSETSKTIVFPPKAHSPVVC